MAKSKDTKNEAVEQEKIKQLSEAEQKIQEANATPVASQTAESTEERGITGMLNDIVLTALNKGASDIHLEPHEGKMVVRYRIDGILKDIYNIEKKYEETLVFKIKVNAKLRTDEHFAPQDGRIRFTFDQKLDTRISILPTAKGEKVVIRLLTQNGRSFKLEDLGFRENELEVVKKAYMKPYGSIFASGPTGSGKTTSLYAILQTINSREINITTVEDPVEYEIDGVNHVQINKKAGLTFGDGLRSILRQDPDVIMVGEIRDSETAKIATNAALTGHLVLSTIHTNDSVTTIPRLIDMGVEPYLVATTVNLVIAQRLARKIDPTKKQPKKISQEEYNELKLYRPDIAAHLKIGDQVFEPVVSTQGSTEDGYKGRVGLYEVLEITEEIRKIIISGANTDQIYNQARKEGLKLILEDGIEKMREGLISLSELIRVTALKE
ncbi:type II/IV secretion system protein [Candidatus Dojkabacteria bacterium]|uniref:Type II/IV secretion system protein n=1 Tax=Candidatus Dojkabacteria bacterium TaxID=2099670 RepID=A0A955LBN6_9BACT|nr:type II/IV secretion system protein [Candidatus Dojkabacteria bacterium]